MEKIICARQNEQRRRSRVQVRWNRSKPLKNIKKKNGKENDENDVTKVLIILMMINCKKKGYNTVSLWQREMIRLMRVQSDVTELNWTDVVYRR